MSIFTLQLWVILFYNKQIREKSSIDIVYYTDETGKGTGCNDQNSEKNIIQIASGWNCS
jgi:hypothetical protein